MARWRAARRRASGALTALCLFSWLLASSAAAHGVSPRVLSPLTLAPGGLGLLSLSRGLALRGDAGYDYFCPAHWDGSESDPVAYLPRGSAVIALPTGLFTIGSDGSTTPYAESGLGTVVALATSSSGLYALALRASRYELRRLEPEHSQIVWSAPSAALDWQTLSASESSLQLLHLSSGVLTQLVVPTAGGEAVEARAEVAPDTLTVEGRVVGMDAYAVLRSESGDRLELGRIEQGKWLSLARASASIGGPVSTLEGQRLVAVDGALSSFDDEKRGPRIGNELVTELTRFEDVVYASVRGGLKTLRGEALGALVFDFAELRGPRVTGLAPAESSACEAAWQHLQVDLVAAGLVDTGATRDAGPVESSDAGALDAGERAQQVLDASARDSQIDPPSSDASQVSMLPEASPGARSASSGCAVAAGSSSGDEAWWLSCLLALVLASLRSFSARREALRRTSS